MDTGLFRFTSVERREQKAESETAFSFYQPCWHLLEHRFDVIIGCAEQPLEFFLLESKIEKLNTHALNGNNILASHTYTLQSRKLSK